MGILGTSTIQAMIEETLREYEIPGMALALFRSDEILLQEVKGFRRLNASAPIGSHDKFHLGSNTKAMTATVLASLVEEGILFWDLTLAEVFFDFEDALHPSYRPMTLRHLLSHRAGIQPFTDGTELCEVPELIGSSREKRDQFAQWLLQKAPFTEPGAQHLYSNAGYTIAAAMAERASDRSWESLMCERLFEPLDLNGGFGWPALHNPDQPWGHIFSGDLERHFEKWETSGTLQPHSPTDPYQLGPVHAPGGDIHLPIMDFARFCQMHLKGCRGETIMLKPETFQALHADPYNQNYGMGWAIIKAPDTSCVSYHNGSAGTFYSAALIDPRDDRGIVIACNAGHIKAWQGCNALMQRIVDGDIESPRSKVVDV